MEQCVFCQSVYNKEDSTSSKPASLCSIECEKGFNEHQKALENWLYTSPLKNN
jgi:hypothetical protein